MTPTLDNFIKVATEAQGSRPKVIGVRLGCQEFGQFAESLRESQFPELEAVLKPCPEKQAATFEIAWKEHPELAVKILVYRGSAANLFEVVTVEPAKDLTGGN